MKFQDVWLRCLLIVVAPTIPVVSAPLVQFPLLKEISRILLLSATLSIVQARMKSNVLGNIILYRYDKFCPFYKSIWMMRNVSISTIWPTRNLVISNQNLGPIKRVMMLRKSLD
ncbi:hypothetical protein MKX01_029240 [Papaver californicum]|nr:hypothetical protein MKX01_029240 [Papaver californicum]